MIPIEVEIFKPITGYEGFYEVSNYGIIRNSRSGRIRKSFFNKDGYKIIVLHKKAVRKGWSIHTLVARAFVPNPNNYLEINHLDLIKDNNFYKNLEWTTREGNMQHAFANRTIKRVGYSPRKPQQPITHA